MVIPIQFVLFPLSAIIGSAILYGDFRKAQFHQIVTFLYGCAATFAGVFVIAWAPRDTGYDTEELTNEEEPTSSVPGSPEQTRIGSGTIGRRRRATLVLPSGVNAVTSGSIGRKRSVISMGISPAQVRHPSFLTSPLRLNNISICSWSILPQIMSRSWSIARKTGATQIRNWVFLHLTRIEGGG